MDTAESTVPEQTDDVNGPTTDSEELVKPESPDDYIDDEVPAENGEHGVTRNVRTDVRLITSQLLKDPKTVAAFQEKLATLVGNSSGYIESLPKSVRRRLKALKRIQSEIFLVQAKFYEEVHALEHKYESIYAPLYDQREAIINASVEPTDEECQWETDDEEDEEEDEDQTRAKVVEVDETKPESEQTDKPKPASEQNQSELDEKTAGVPEFWLTIFKNVDSLCSLVQDNDEPVLKNLRDIKVKFLYPETMGFTLEFVFAPNEYFTNTVLTKEYVMRTKPNPDCPLQFEGPEIVHCKGCNIDWKADKNITVRKQKHKSPGGSKKLVTKVVKVESFFNFFSPPEVKEDDEDDTTRELLLADFEIGQLLQDRIVPRAVLYFTGEALAEDEEDETEGEGDDGDADDGSDYDEDADKDYQPPKGVDNDKPNCTQQ